MRGVLLVVAVGAVVACGSAVRRPSHYAWQQHVEPRLGVTVDLGRGWRAATVDDALLLTPPGGDDFAIVIVRGRAQLDDPEAIARLGAVDGLAWSDAEPARAGLAVSVRAGTATLRALGAKVTVRLARIRDGAGRHTFVGAAIATGSAERGEEAFDHVVASLALSEPAAPAREPGPPPWLGHRPATDRAEPEPDPDDPDGGGE